MHMFLLVFRLHNQHAAVSLQSFTAVLDAVELGEVHQTDISMSGRDGAFHFTFTLHRK